MKINFTSEDIKLSVVNSLIKGESLSMTRIGDGEIIIVNNEKEKINKFCNNQIGRQITLNELKKSQSDIIESIIKSNILGLPTEKHCKKSFLWEKTFDLFKFINDKNKKDWINKKYCSIDSHLELLYSGNLFQIFKEIEKITIVSPRNIVDQLQTKFTNIKEVEWYSLPAEQKYENIKNKEINIFDKIDQISLNLKSKSRKHELLIFGAGPFGKKLGTDFSNSGGVSLDLGSVFDLLVGKLTRGSGKGINSTIKDYVL